MIPWKATRHWKRQFILSLALVLATLLPCAPANAQQDDLIHAASIGDLSRVKALLASGADVSSVRANGATALMYASSQGHLDVVQVLLAANANVNAKMRSGGTALGAASVNDHLDVLEALLHAGADPNTKDTNGVTPLMAASLVGHADIVRALIDAKADPNAATPGGFTALMSASGEGHLSAVQTLLEKGAEVNAKRSDGGNALMWASYNGHPEVVQALINGGADKNAETRDGRSALDAATAGGNASVRALLSPASAPATPSSLDTASALKEPTLMDWSSLGDSLATQDEVDRAFETSGTGFRMCGSLDGESFIMTRLFVPQDVLSPYYHKAIPVSKFFLEPPDAAVEAHFPGQWKVSISQTFGEQLFECNGLALIPVGSEIRLPSKQFITIGKKMRNGKIIVRTEGLEIEPGTEISK
jgi:serine/threonine-protein phosphatase 6 regulatory ankyrin repeat subunit B